MTKMTEHEAILLDNLFQTSRVSKINQYFDDDNRAIDALLRTVRATAVRDAAKDFNYQARLDNSHWVVTNWLFDRADGIETGTADS